jgi:tetraacyldisaccharide 4'-kinase
LRRPLLLPLVPLYWLGTRLKNAAYDRRWLRAHRLTRPVVSVGSLSAGGAGKTPVVLMLAELLRRHGVGVDVLSRGYGRGSGVVEEVDPAGHPIRFGDEPLEMARRGLRVIVGADRVAAGRFAEGLSEDGRALPEAHLSDDKAVAKVGHKMLSEIHLLDDGFQHRRLGRDLDVVLLTLEDARDWLLPAGNLREPLASLRRAHVVVVREDEAVELAGLTRGMEVWLVRRELVLPAERPMRPVVFCGIARPEGFLAMLGEAGVEPAGRMIFPDHHAYTDEHFRLLEDAAEHTGADGFCTTAKDAVKIPDAARQRLERMGPVWVAELRVSLLDEAQAMATLRRNLNLA